MVIFTLTNTSFSVRLFQGILGILSMKLVGRGGGLVVNAPAYCSVDPNLNPAGY